MAGGIGSVAGLQGPHRLGLGGGGDQHRPRRDPLPGEGQRLGNHRLRLGEEPPGIEVQHRHQGFRRRHLPEGRLRAASGEAGGIPTDRLAHGGAGRVPGAAPVRRQGAGETQAEARGAHGDPSADDGAPERFEVTVEYGVGDGRALAPGGG